jgi:hypothetical protein
MADDYRVEKRDYPNQDSRTLQEALKCFVDQPGRIVKHLPVFARADCSTASFTTSSQKCHCAYPAEVVLRKMNEKCFVVPIEGLPLP